ncbi:MAG: phosphopentomutase [Chloroflexota bacterium]|nr:phosphopentomutase [Chloroflexota bacterium]MBI5702030.1 phosphopentomutase [Chloroflexota bacterium]
MTKLNRVTVIVLDGVGAGEAPDAAAYGDVGSNSLGNVARAIGGLNTPNMYELGLGNITSIQGVPPNPRAKGAFGRFQPRSAGKDTVIGHWEMMGIYLPVAFPTYPNGFPPEVLDPFRKAIGRDVLGNKPASGTEILKELGMEHMRTGNPIVYTSADSVFQIAAHEEIIPLEELYRMCQIARDILQGEHGVGRVIARPFLGDSPETFKRTAHRRDYPRNPEYPTMMQKLVAAGKDVYSVGKIDDIFNHQGITKKNHVLTNKESLDVTLTLLEEDFEGLLFVNLIEFDMIYGHRNDPRGYADALEQFDAYLPEIQKRLQPGDLVIVTGDHGVDPTTPGTDHSREYVPLLAFGPNIKHGVDLGDRDTLADIAGTLAEIFSLEPQPIGKSFLQNVID